MAELSEPNPDLAFPWAKDTRSYNDRLFGPGLRGWIHRARFRWVATQYEKRSSSPPAVLEIGCFDGKTLDYLDPSPRRYLGLDANHEGGLDIAAKRWAHVRSASFRQCETADQVPTDERFDVSISMETFEHVPDDVLDGYIARLGEVTDGYALITVPNEIGPVCLLKQTAKKLILGGSQFSWSDIWNAALGRSDRIARLDHRGFDYRALIRKLRRSFDVVAVRGIPFPFLPAYLNVTVGIVLTPRRAG
jgi:hypothetical protein